MKADIILLTHNRRVFSQIAVHDLYQNTRRELVRKVVLVDDGSLDGTRDFLRRFVEGRPGLPTELHLHSAGSVVASMNIGLSSCRAPFVVKLDNDVVVPPGWLERAMSVMHRHPELKMLGITQPPSYLGIGVREPNGSLPPRAYGYKKGTHIGGVGIFRREIFSSLPRPDTNPEKRKYHGFTNFQWAHPYWVKGWIDPGLPVLLLDMVPKFYREGLIDEYRKLGWQRGCAPYHKESRFWRWRFPDEP